MKKTILLVGVLALLVIGFATTACSKGDIANGCDCIYSAGGISSPSTHFIKEAVKAVDASTCAEFEDWADANDAATGGTWACTSAK